MTTNTPTDPPILTGFAKAILRDDILSGMGLESLSESEKSALYRTMVATVQTRVLARVLDGLNEAEQAALAALLERGDGPTIESFVEARQPNLADLIEQEALLYKTEMVQNARHVRSVLGLPDLVAKPSNAKPTLPVHANANLPMVVEPPAPPSVYHPDEQ
jgi:hypothetical protein